MRNGIRSFVSLWYLLGCLVHVYFGLFAPEIYQPFGTTSIFPSYAILWHNLVMPSITFFALLLAAYEILVGCLLVSKGKWVKYGVILSLLFNLFLIQMGLGYPADNEWQSFLINRLPNLVFIALQIPLLWGWDKYSIPEIVWRSLHK